ncbi:hypothetical protein S40293_03546 [Stachybotrys chartarum IBT 40293]|nr:hypothetical protein S40293_03546 [Stachybotrys chartarum IBT 40293]
MDPSDASTSSFGHPFPTPSASSPANPLRSPTRTRRRIEKRNPSVTPRRFGRFFTPRNTASIPNRTILANLEPNAVNNCPISPQSVFSEALDSSPLCSSPIERLNTAAASRRKRKGSDGPEPVVKRRGVLLGDLSLPPVSLGFEDVKTQEASSDDKSVRESMGQRRKAVLNHFFKSTQERPKTSSLTPLLDTCDLATTSSETNPLFQDTYRPKPIRKFANRGFESQLLDREHGFSSNNGKHYLAYPAADPRTETASFYSHANDTYMCTSQSGQGTTIPFCLASCRNSSITAVGDEEGCVRFFSTEKTDKPTDSKISLYGKVHDNAIMSMAFSEDDMRLATACGDRTGAIIDVHTQTVAVKLEARHLDSLRQIAFQPGQSNGNILSTSDRGGRVQIWDLRCSYMPINTFSSNTSSGMVQRNLELRPVPAQTANTIDNAHTRSLQGNSTPASITALQWLQPGREHLLLSASEANARIKLWDTRYVMSRRQVDGTPLATTCEPSTHAGRPYGITSMALSADSARLYAVCRDSTVYAFSTNHLMLGHAPELRDGTDKRRPTNAQGHGPLYGLKHSMFHAHSFYIKCAIRPYGSHANEMLAVGSTNNCAMLFPLDERYMRTRWAQHAHDLDFSAAAASLPSTPSQSFSSSKSSAASASTLPIYNIGTPLIRGHEREVAVPSWTWDGKLVTASDDYIVRHWQEGEGEARHLRQVGEFGGERHMAGWADVGSDWDLEDDDDE